MKTLRVGVNYFVNADDIQIIEPWPTRVAARHRLQAIEEGRFFDATRGKPILSLIHLGEGWVVASPYYPNVLVRRPQEETPSRTPTRQGPAREPVGPGVFVRADPDAGEEEGGEGGAKDGAGPADPSAPAGSAAGDAGDEPAPRRPFPPWWISRS